ncbi:hypothetical protein NU10_11385 [Flavobacterium dauae]|uniref:hypothetical protein n=1 Tax=Flavobacterium dauae TaxID=1563479 RepID=UPI00101B4A20|nr:hypothetical protein [Flavobacterium dauae]WLD23305.1 hypothetical protein NU10_11385 [Flavobacterium dauae]
MEQQKFHLEKDELLKICKSSVELSPKAELLENRLNNDAIGGYVQHYSEQYTQHYGESYSRQIEIGGLGIL